MVITEVYKKYKVVPILQLHQLRVASVASVICRALGEEIRTNDVIKACLVHDMGNILKFDMAQFPSAFEPEGVEYWQSVKNELASKYQTTDEHVATLAILDELGVNEGARGLVDLIGFRSLPKVMVMGSLEQKICCYSDMRVGPLGVLSINERLADGDKRYKARIDHQNLNGGESKKAALEIEEELFEKLSISPEDISDESIRPIVEELKTVEI